MDNKRKKESEIEKTDVKKKKKKHTDGAPVFPPQTDFDVKKKMMKDDDITDVKKKKKKKHTDEGAPVFPPQTDFDVKKKMMKDDDAVLPVLPPQGPVLFFKKEEFNLKTEHYKDFIKRMRKSLGTGRKKICAIRVMPPRDVEGKRIYIRLDVVGIKTCTLLIRETDFYIIGHVTSNGVMYALEGDDANKPEVTTQFSEEGKDPIHFKFNGKYKSLLRISGIGEKADIPIGREAVEEAIAVLSKPVSDREHPNVALAYLTMIVVFGEGIRFSPIMKKAMTEGDIYLENRLSGWVNHWGGMSDIIAGFAARTAQGIAQQDNASFGSPNIQLDDETPITTIKQLRSNVKMIIARNALEN